MDRELLIAVFVDFENLAIGVRDTNFGEFQIELVLKRLLEKGRIVYKKAYCDWSNYRSEVRKFHAQGIQLVDIPQSRMSGKNSADIHMVVDALDLCYAKSHIDIFALLSGDSDFSPLVSKLKENQKRVIGCGVKSSTSELLIASCDEFIYYDDLARTAINRTAIKQKRTKRKSPSKTPDRKQEALERIAEIVESLVADYDQIWGSQVKQTIRRVYPGFSESYYGFRNFSEFLKHAEEAGVIALDYDKSRGNYRVSLRESGSGPENS